MKTVSYDTELTAVCRTCGREHSVKGSVVDCGWPMGITIIKDPEHFALSPCCGSFVDAAKAPSEAAEAKP